MNQKLMHFKSYVNKLLTRAKRFSLTELMERFAESLEKYKNDPYIFPLLEPYCKELDSRLTEYKRAKKTCKYHPMRLKEIRKRTAKDFFNIIERLGAIIPKWLSALPPELKSDEFGGWKEKTERSEFRGLAKIVTSSSQLQSLRDILDEIANAVAGFGGNKRLKKMVISKIDKENVIDGENISIGAPTRRQDDKTTIKNK